HCPPSPATGAPASTAPPTPSSSASPPLTSPSSTSTAAAHATSPTTSVPAFQSSPTNLAAFAGLERIEGPHVVHGRGDSGNQGEIEERQPDYVEVGHRRPEEIVDGEVVVDHQRDDPGELEGGLPLPSPRGDDLQAFAHRDGAQ